METVKNCEIQEEREYRTKNIKFCAYLRLQKINPFKVEKLGRGKGIFFFLLTEDRWDILKMNFNNSEYIEYAHCLEACKDLCY